MGSLSVYRTLTEVNLPRVNWTRDHGSSTREWKVLCTTLVRVPTLCANRINTCASSGAAAIQEDLIAGSYSADGLGKVGLEHTVNLTPAGSGSTKIFLTSYETSGLGLGRIPHIVYSHRQECNSQPYRNSGRRIYHMAKSLVGREGVRVFGTPGTTLALTFVVSVCLFHMVRWGQNL